MTAIAAFDARQAILDVLNALEYGTRKEEKDILQPILKVSALKHGRKKPLAEQIMRSPGFDSFFLDVLRAVRPFSQMLVDIYSFLNANRLTTSRRASQIRVHFEEAKARLDFDISNFPRELVKTLTEFEVFGSVVQLRFPGIDPAKDPAGPRPNWSGTEAERLWAAISPNWDNEFYDDGFHRAASYASSILARASDRERRQAHIIVDPIMDRLAACCRFFELLPSAPGTLMDTVHLSGSQPVTIASIVPKNHRIRDPGAEAVAILSRPALSFGNTMQTISERLFYEVRAFAIAITLWQTPSFRRPDKDDWILRRTNHRVDTIPPSVYLDLLDRLAVDYRRRLDEVAPIVDQYSETAMVEALLEFLRLPFWKHRWYLYELWTLVAVLRIGSSLSQVELSTTLGTNDILEWKLPGAMAKHPVAIIGTGEARLCCWTQRKSYHPGTGAGLEPDLRITRQSPQWHDVIIIENKDRLTARKEDLREILSRYAAGTCAESIWLVNYESFPASAFSLESEGPQRVRLVSNFRPNSLDPRFEAEISEVLLSHLAPHAPAKPKRLVEWEAKLSWGQAPLDLDLYAWIQDGAGVHEVSYSNRSCESAALDRDGRQGNGTEIIRAKGSSIKSAVIAVNNYSGEAGFSGSHATLRISIPDCPDFRLSVPTTGVGEWWHCVRIGSEDASIEVINAISSAPPDSQAHINP